MMDFFFFVKTLILTIAIVLVLQLQVDEHTLEWHAMTFVQSSTVTTPLHAAKRGAVKLVHDLSHQLANTIHDHVGKNKKEETRLKQESSFHWSHGSKSTEADED